MKMVVKIAVVMGVSLATWHTTRAIVAQQRRAAMTQPDAQVPAPIVVTEKRTAAVPGQAPKAVELGAMGALFQAHSRSFDVAPGDGGVTVSAHISIADARRGVGYVWMLRATDSEWRPLAGRVYDDQLFAMEADGKKEATFSDEVATPPGTTYVELFLYSVKDKSDLSKLEDPNNPGVLRVMRWFRDVTQ